MRPSYCNGIEINTSSDSDEYVLTFYQEYPARDGEGKLSTLKEALSSVVLSAKSLRALRGLISEIEGKVAELAEKQNGKS